MGDNSGSMQNRIQIGRGFDGDMIIYQDREDENVLTATIHICLMDFEDITWRISERLKKTLIDELGSLLGGQWFEESDPPLEFMLNVLKGGQP